MGEETYVGAWERIVEEEGNGGGEEGNGGGDVGSVEYRIVEEEGKGEEMRGM